MKELSKPLVSIILPVYNGEKYLLEMLDSIKNQLYRPIKLIIGDDYSTDKSLDICRKWAEDNNEISEFEIVILSNENNKGLSGNISKLAKYVQGEYVFLADQDDIWDKNKISSQVSYFEKNPECVVNLCDRRIVNSDNKLLEESNYRLLNYKKNKMNFEEVILHRGAYASNCMAVRINEYFDSCFDIPFQIVTHDSYIAVMESVHGSVDFIFEPMLSYRIHNNNLSGNYSSQTSKGIVDCFLKNLKKAKRIKQSHELDGKLIENDLYIKFGINLSNFKNVYMNVEEVNIWGWAFERTKKERKIVGIWNR